MDDISAGIIVCMGSANKTRPYNVTSSLIGLGSAQNDPYSEIEAKAGSDH